MTEQLAEEIAALAYSKHSDNGNDTADLDTQLIAAAAREVLEDPTPAGLVDRLRVTIAAAATRLVYGNAEALERAAAEMQREDELVEQHAAALRRAIGPALRNAEAFGTGWIRIDASCAPGEPVAEIYDWTISSPNPTTISVHQQQPSPTTQEKP